MFCVLCFSNFITFAVVIVFLVYLYLKKCYRYWEDRNVPYVKPKSLIFGSNLDLILHRTSFQEYHATLYKELAPHRYGGYFYFQRPFLLVRDPEIVKYVLSVDFPTFHVRHNDADESEPLRLHLFNLYGEKWRVLREKLSPAFSPTKIRMMLDLMKECSGEFVKVLGEAIEEEPDVFITDFVARYGTDIISTCAFGFHAQTLLNPDIVFRVMTKKILEPHPGFKLRSFLLAFSPKLCRWLKLPMFDKEAVEYFVKLVDETIKYRESTNMVRNDFIDLLINLKKEEEAANAKDKNRTNKIDTSPINLAAQCFAFFFAGYATQNLTLTMALFELARNPDVQEKLRQEVDNAFEENNGVITYDVLNSMKYLDQVVSETIRSYPGLPVLLRQCTKNYKVPDTDFVIEKDTTVFIPRYGLNHDKEYFANPDAFDPDHFTDDAKAKRHRYSHLLFGDGPRKCLGMRFGQMHAKLALTMLLRHFEFTPSPKMKLPLQFTLNIISTSIRGGVWIRCYKRSFS